MSNLSAIGHGFFGHKEKRDSAWVDNFSHKAKFNVNLIFCRSTLRSTYYLKITRDLSLIRFDFLV